MNGVPRQAVWVVAALLVAMAALGVFQGWRRSAPLNESAAADAGLTPGATAALGAKTASALAEPPPIIMNETQVRAIAKQEAQAVLAGRSSSGSSSSSSGEESSSSPAPTPRAAPSAPSADRAPDRPAPDRAPPEPSRQDSDSPQAQGPPLF